MDPQRLAAAPHRSFGTPHAPERIRTSCSCDTALRKSTACVEGTTTFVRRSNFRIYRARERTDLICPEIPRLRGSSGFLESLPAPIHRGGRRGRQPPARRGAPRATIASAASTKASRSRPPWPEPKGRTDCGGVPSTIPQPPISARSLPSLRLQLHSTTVTRPCLRDVQPRRSAHRPSVRS